MVASPSHIVSGDIFTGGDGTDTLDIVTTSLVTLTPAGIQTDVENLHALGAVALAASAFCQNCGANLRPADPGVAAARNRRRRPRRRRAAQSSARSCS